MLPYRRPRKPRARQLVGRGPAPPPSPEQASAPPAEVGPQDPEPEGANGPFARLFLGGLGLLILLLLAALTWYGHRNGHPSGTCFGTGDCLPAHRRGSGYGTLGSRP